MIALNALHEAVKPLGFQAEVPGGLQEKTVQSVHVCSEDIEIL